MYSKYFCRIVIGDIVLLLLLGSKAQKLFFLMAFFLVGGYPDTIQYNAAQKENHSFGKNKKHSNLQ